MGINITAISGGSEKKPTISEIKKRFRRVVAVENISEINDLKGRAKA